MPRTQKIPLKGTWERDEFIRVRALVNDYNKTPMEKPDEIRCSFCIKVVVQKIVDVVEYGEKIACHSCFQARYRNRPQRYKHFPVPQDLQGKSFDKVIIDEAVEKAVEIQDKNVTQIRSQRSAVDETSSPKTD
jgi:hypothetical protein